MHIKRRLTSCGHDKQANEEDVVYDVILHYVVFRLVVVVIAEVYSSIRCICCCVNVYSQVFL